MRKIYLHKRFDSFYYYVQGHPTITIKSNISGNSYIISSKEFTYIFNEDRTSIITSQHKHIICK